MAPVQDPNPLMPTSRTNENGFEEYGCIPSYTQLLLVLNLTCLNPIINLYYCANKLFLSFICRALARGRTYLMILGTLETTHILLAGQISFIHTEINKQDLMCSTKLCTYSEIQMLCVS